MNKISLKLSYIFNITIVILTIIALVVMFARIDFMNMPNPVNEKHWYGMLKYFTTLSNIFVAVASLFLALEEQEVLKDSRKVISFRSYLFKLIATVSVTVTFLTVFIYLGPGSKGGLSSMLTNSNLFFHFIIPVLSIISFVLFERTDKIDKKYIKYGILPVLMYGVFYISNVVIHIDNYKVSTKYDWYWFFQKGLWLIFIVIPLMLFLSYFITYILYKLNYKKRK